MLLFYLNFIIVLYCIYYFIILFVLFYCPLSLHSTLEAEPRASLSGSGTLSIQGAAIFGNGSSLGIEIVKLGLESGNSSSLILASNATVGIQEERTQIRGEKEK
jgi:hypothetical protein